MPADSRPPDGDLVDARPASTYRVQLAPGFGFDAAAELAPYLAALGVTHLYASPELQAAAGSTHGYDVVDHHRANEELGGAVAHARMCAALRAQGLGHLLDVVPNHMAISGRENAWWWDVLENGASSVYASYFDIDWDPPESKLRHTVLLPVLGDHYGRVLEAGDLHLRREGGSFTVHYYEHVAPVAPRSLDTLLELAAARAGSAELESIATALSRLPPSTATDRESVRERHRDKEVLRARLAALCEEERAVAAAVDGVVDEINADPDSLDALLSRQNYRLAYWRTAGSELDWRRFFDITTLVTLRAEDPQVFADTHDLVLRWVAEGTVDGLRIDHPDGLRDPEGYLRRLHEATGGTWTVVEKILERDERLPPSWPAAGTTGYDFLNRVGGLFVDPAGEGPLTEIYGELTGESTDWTEVAYAKRHQVMRQVLAADVERLTARFVDVCERHRRHRDYTRDQLRAALREVIACFPVYRTYVRAHDGWVSDTDEGYVTTAVDEALGRRPDLDPELFAFLRDLLLLRVPGGEPEAELAMRFQQLSAPVMAKGVEDTAFYTFCRFVALNEVGGSPGAFGTAVAGFHAACEEAAREWPQSLLATSTHDTKRSEDVRARLFLLSEIPQRWGEAVRRWSALADRHRTDGRPDANIEYLLWQTMVGAHPLSLDRALTYVEKASREAKTHTSWIDPQPAYDTALRRFVEGVYADRALLDDVASFAEPLVAPGRVNALAQTLVKLTAPGVPDIYQGCELWDLSLVDPDNRRPVDFGHRRALLEAVGRPATTAADTWADADSGAPKLFLTHRALAVRQARPHAFDAKADYVPLAVQGRAAPHVVAFARGGEVATVVPRLVLGLHGEWGDTTVELPPGRWRDELGGADHDGGHVRMDELLAEFPVALLARRP